MAGDPYAKASCATKSKGKKRRKEGKEKGEQRMEHTVTKQPPFAPRSLVFSSFLAVRNFLVARVFRERRIWTRMGSTMQSRTKRKRRSSLWTGKPRSCDLRTVITLRYEILEDCFFLRPILPLLEISYSSKLSKRSNFLRIFNFSLS